MAQQASLAASMLQLAENMVQIIEAIAGYKAQAEAAGFSTDIAERMAADYHKFLLTSIAQQSAKRASQ